MIERTPDLQRLLDLTGEAIARRASPSESVCRAGARIFSALARPEPRATATVPSRLPACDYLAAALAAARAAGGDVASLADAFATIEPSLTWRRRPGAEDAAPDFRDGHANAVIVGPGGLEPRDDAMVGVSLMAPAVQYPDHRHPPEEVYVVLSPGEWRQRNGPWHEPGPGGFVHNPPGIVHAMRSGKAPLLAIWCLWVAGE
jgi:quercetin dioxygenase-like cupin family protein